MKNRRRINLFILTIVAVLLAITMIGCSKVSKPSSGDSGSATASTASAPFIIKDKIKIGVVSPITGDQAKIGQDMRNGVLLAVKDANARGGIAGYKVVAAPQDDKHDPREAVVVASRYAGDSEIGAVIGHLNSSCTMPAGAVYSKAGILEISPASTNPEISKRGYATFFRTCATDSVQAPATADYAIQSLGKKRFVILHDKTTYGEGLADQFRGEVAKLKASALLYEGITQGDNDYSAILTRVKSLNPDAIYFGGMYPEGSMLVKQAREMGLKAPMIGADGIMDDKFVELAGSAAEGSIGSFLSPSIEKIPTAAKFAEDYRKSYGAIGPYSPYSYDAASVALKAIELAIKKDGKKTEKGIEIPREAILREAHALRDFPGVTGKLNFDKQGDPLNQVIYVYQVKNGKWVFLGPARK